MTKTQKIIYYVLLVIVTALFLFTAYDKLSGDPQAEAGFALAGLPIWFMYFIGIAEALGAIGLWIKSLQKWAAYGLSIILVGAIVTTAMYMSVLEALMPLVVLIVLWIVYKMGRKNMPAAPAM